MGRRHVLAATGIGLDLAGIGDISPAALAEAQKEGVPEERCFVDVRRMLHVLAPEAVIVATTAPSHAELVCLAAEAGARCILCEKPLAVSLGEAERMIGVCREKGARLGVNHQMRYMEQYTAVKALIGGPELGGLESVTVVGGNMGMAMNGLHYFEMFRYMADSPPLSAQAWFDSAPVPNPRGPQFADKAGQIRLTNAAGQRFYMDIASGQGHGLIAVYACARGHILVDELAGRMLVSHRREEDRALPSTRYGLPCLRHEREIAPADVVLPSAKTLQALLRGDEWPDGACGLAAMRALVAGYISDENGSAPVRIDGDLPKDRIFPWA
jgi:predicted dehydrogenase